MKNKIEEGKYTEMFPIVLSIAKKYVGKGLELNDLVSEGYVGLAESDQNSPIEIKRRYIHRSIQRALSTHGYPAKLSEKQSKIANRINRASIILEQKLGRKPSTEEISEAIDIPKNMVNESIDMRTKMLSADAPLTHRQSASLIDVIEDKSIILAEDTMTQQTLKKQIEKSIEFLNEREQKIIKAYYGIGEEASTLAQIADRMGIKRERARQIRDHALRKMRKTKIEE